MRSKRHKPRMGGERQRHPPRYSLRVFVAQHGVLRTADDGPMAACARCSCSHTVPQTLCPSRRDLAHSTPRSTGGFHGTHVITHRVTHITTQSSWQITTLTIGADEGADHIVKVWGSPGGSSPGGSTSSSVGETPQAHTLRLCWCLCTTTTDVVLCCPHVGQQGG